MIDYAAIRRRVRGPAVPLPIYFKDDLSVDYEGIERYGRWIVRKGITCMLLTHGYSQLGFITREENLEITRIYAKTAGERAVFFASTRGEIWEALDIIEELAQTGSHGVFIVPLFLTGPEYIIHLKHLLKQTQIPILTMSGTSPLNPGEPLIPVQEYASLIEHENFIGLKDDVNVPAYRLGVIDNYGDRLAIIGGGVLRNYMQFQHYSQQSELAGYFSPQSTLRLVEHFDAGKLRDALRMIEEFERVLRETDIVEWRARNQVAMFTLGFARSYKVRPPLVSATVKQAKQIMALVKKNPQVFAAFDGGE